MSNARDAACALNTLFREGHDLLGDCDGPALSDFVHKFFCGDDPVDGDGKWNVFNLTVLYWYVWNVTACIGWYGKSSLVPRPSLDLPALILHCTQAGGGGPGTRRHARDAKDRFKVESI